MSVEGRLEEAGQGHLARALERLSGRDREVLAAEIAALDLDLVRRLVQRPRGRRSRGDGGDRPPGSVERDRAPARCRRPGARPPRPRGRGGPAALRGRGRRAAGRRPGHPPRLRRPQGPLPVRAVVGPHPLLAPRCQDRGPAGALRRAAALVRAHLPGQRRAHARGIRGGGRLRAGARVGTPGGAGHAAGRSTGPPARSCWRSPGTWRCRPTGTAGCSRPWRARGRSTR